MGSDSAGHASNSMYAKSFKWLLAILAGLAQAQAASTDDDCKGTSSECVAVGKWNFSVALGAGLRSNPLVTGKNIPLVVIPQFSYYGNRFFINDLDLGFTLVENTTNTFSLVGSPGYDRVFFYRSDLQNIFIGLPGLGTYVAQRVPASTPNAVQFPARARRITYLAGPEWTFKLSGISGQLDVLQESKGSFTANLGVTWKSAAIVNYYYGSAGMYEAGSALNPFFKLGYTLPLAGKWRFNAFAEYERLGNAIANSPIVEERFVATAFVGAIYTF